MPEITGGMVVPHWVNGFLQWMETNSDPLQNPIPCTNCNKTWLHPQGKPHSISGGKLSMDILAYAWNIQFCDLLNLYTFAHTFVYIYDGSQDVGVRSYMSVPFGIKMLEVQQALLMHRNRASTLSAEIVQNAAKMFDRLHLKRPATCE